MSDIACCSFMPVCLFQAGREREKAENLPSVTVRGRIYENTMSQAWEDKATFQGLFRGQYEQHDLKKSQ